MDSQPTLPFFATNTQILVINTPFVLESGAVLPRLEIAYHTYGRLNKAQDNVVWVCHALTGNSDAAAWWDGLIGTGRVFDPEQYFIVCANMIGSCYGSSGALSLNPATNERFYTAFPNVTIRDVVQAHIILRKHLGIERIFACVGGSMGGQQVLEWAIAEPDVLECIVPMATNARHSPWGIAFNASQRLALEADSTFGERRPDAGANGLKAARAIGILSYRNYDTFLQTQFDENEKSDNFRASSYQEYQGEKLTKRFNAHSYWTLSKTMDSHNVGRGRGGVAAAFASIRAKTLVIGISTDILFPVEEQRFIADHIPDAEYVEITSRYGHDGFLIEFAAIGGILEDFFAEMRRSPHETVEEGDVFVL